MTFRIDGQSFTVRAVMVRFGEGLDRASLEALRQPCVTRRVERRSSEPRAEGWPRSGSATPRSSSGSRGGTVTCRANCFASRGNLEAAREWRQSPRAGLRRPRLGGP